MPSRRLKDAIEDARGILAMFSAQPVGEDDCVAAVREAILNLESAISHALDHDREGRVLPEDRVEIEQRLRNLFLLWDKCGTRTQALLLDMRVVFGPHIGVTMPSHRQLTEPS